MRVGREGVIGKQYLDCIRCHKRILLLKVLLPLLSARTASATATRATGDSGVCEGVWFSVGFGVLGRICGGGELNV